MRAVHSATIVLSLVLLATPVAARAQSHVVDGKDLEGAVSRRAAEPEAERQRLRSLLGRPDVRRIARSNGIDLRRVETGVATLSTEELARIAPYAAAADADLAGGQDVRISTMTIILVLLIVILVVLLV
jgi:hypothetical protein